MHTVVELRSIAAASHTSSRHTHSHYSMANQLCRPIQPDEEVVVLSRYTGGALPPKSRTFRCSHGAGMDPRLDGTGIWGVWSASGVSGRIESYMIDASSVAPSGDQEAVAAVLRQLRG